MVKFDEGIDTDFDKAMGSIDDMYADMFSTKSSKGTSGDASKSIDDMYNQMMGQNKYKPTPAKQ
jgi:hypothetical protein